MVFETVRTSLSSRQVTELTEIINKSRTFVVDDFGYVCVVNVQNGHPATRMGPRPVGLITSDKAQMLNTELSFPQDYHQMLRKLYNGI